MTLESFIREHPRPLLMVPVYFSYEKVLEAPALIAELEGQPKQRESLAALIQVARNLRHEYGSVHVNFGEPVSIDQFLDRAVPDWHALRGDEQRDTARRLTLALGREMAQRISSAVIINPINLFAMAIVPSPRHALDERGLEQQIAWLTAIASRLPYAQEAVLSAVEPSAAVAQAQAALAAAEARIADLTLRAPAAGGGDRALLGLVAVSAIILLLFASQPALATAIPVARDGEAAPDGNGTYGSYSTFGEPCLNDQGRVAFSARLAGTAGGAADDEVITRARAGAPDTTCARVKQKEALG